TTLLHRHPHSFPPRRASDLGGTKRNVALSKAGLRVQPLKTSSERWPRVSTTSMRTSAWPRKPSRALLKLACSESRGDSSSQDRPDRKSTRLNSSHVKISYAV